MIDFVISCQTWLPRCCLQLIAGFALHTTVVAQQLPVPNETYTSRATYLQDRQLLLAADSALAFDADIVLDPAEQRVNQKMLALRKQMTSDYLQTGFFPPSHPFLKSKEHIEQTQLYKLFQIMPKGGILHLHSSAAVDFRWLVDKAVTTPNSYVYWEEPSPAYIKGQVKFFKPEGVPEGFYPTRQLADTQPGFRDELYDLLVLELEELEQDTFDVWNEFQTVFQRIDGLYYYRPIYEEYNRRVFEGLIADGIQHVEARVAFDALYDLDHAPRSGYYTADTTVKLMQNVVREVQAQHPDFTYAMIYTSLRFFDEKIILQELENAYRSRARYPDLIRGFDLVANEDDGNTTLFFLNNWLKMDSLQAVYGVDMPLFLHDGESNRYVVKNLYDAVLLRSQRIGHGYNLGFYPHLQEMVKAQDICIEVCPLSNQILDYIDDLRVHPMSYLLRRGIQCTISSDDPSIFGYSGLSYDYWTIFLAWQLDLQAIKKLAMNSITYSSLPSSQKGQAMENWQVKWKEFVTTADTFLD